MSNFTNEYIRRGYRDIVVVDSSDEEKGDWHGTEKHYETAIAKKNDGFIRLSSYEMREFGPGGSHDIDISETAITRREYEATARGAPVLDSLEVRAKFKKQTEDIDRTQTIKAALSAQAPECKVHGRKMKLVRGPKQYFWGCPKYPKCNNIEWLSVDQKKEAKKLDRLPAIP